MTPNRMTKNTPKTTRNSVKNCFQGYESTTM
jgi:hypothetical protein